MAEPTIKKSRRKWREFFRRLWHRPMWFFVRLGIIALVLATVLLVLFYHIFRDEIELVLTRWVENQTHYLFRPEVTFSSMAMPQLGEFIFEDFRVADPFGRPEEVISTERVRVEFDPLKILSRGINLALVEIQGGNFHVHRDSTGETNLFKIFKSIGGKGENGTRIRVRSFILDNCRVRLEDLDDQPIDNEIERMEGSFTSISGEHVVEVHHGGVTTTYWSVGRAEISGIFPIKSGSLGFRGVRVLKGETDLTGSGFVDFHNRTYEYKITDGRCETAHLPPELKIADRFSGTVGVSVTFSGSFDSTAVQAGLTLDSGVIFDFPVSGLSTLLKYDSGSLSFERIETRACGGTLEGEMHFDVAGSDDSYQIRAHVRDARIEEIGIPNLEKLEGTLSARLDLRARGYSKHDFEIEGTGEMIEGNLGGMRIDSAGVNFSYREGKVRVEDLTLHCWESITTAIGDMENDELFLFLNIENLPARRLGRLLPVTDLSGAIDFSGSLTGRLFDPKLKGSLSISSGAFRNLRFHLLEGTCELEHLADTVQGNLQIDLHGVDFAGQALEKLHLNTEIPHRGLNRFSPLILMQDSLNMLYCNGFYTINPQTGEQEIAVDSLELLYRGVRATGREIMEIQRRGDTTRVTSLSLSTMGGTISGDLELAGTDFFRAGVRSALIFKEIDFSRLAFLLGTDQEAGGRLNGTLDVSGTLASPVCSLEATIEQARFSIITSDRFTARLNLDRGVLDIERLALENPGSTSLITGRIPVPWLIEADSTSIPGQSGRIALDCRLEEFPLAAVESKLVPLSTGVMNGRLHITGTLDKPELSGAVSLSGGSGIIAPFNTRLQNMSGRLEFEQDRIILSDLRSSSPEGSLQFSGQIELDRLQPTRLELNIQGQELVLQQFRYVTRLQVDTDLKLSGTFPDLLLTGNVRVAEGEVSPALGSVSMDTEVGPGAGQTGALVQIPVSPLDYELHFTAEENFWLRNRNASIKLKADILASQHEGQPQVAGEITTVAGTYTIFGRNFRIRYGSLQFQGQATIDPLLDINAERTIRGKVHQGEMGLVSMSGRGVGSTPVTGQQYEIDRNTFVLHIGNTLSDPQFEITVKDKDNRAIEPPLTPEQARTLVLVDQTYREFQQQSSLSQAKMLDQAANLALSQANPYIQEFTGIDEFRIESQLFGRTVSDLQEEERASAQVTVGEFLFETIFFSFSQDLIDPSARSVQIEYLIGRNSSIIGTTDSRGHFSVDFRYLIKY